MDSQIKLPALHRRRRDLPAIELSIAVFLLATTREPFAPAALLPGGLVVLLALIRGYFPGRKNVRQWLALASGLAWGGFGAVLLSVADAALVVLGLALVIAAALPAADNLRQMRLFVGGVLAPGALMQLLTAQPESVAVGGLLLAFGVVADTIGRALTAVRQPLLPDQHLLDQLMRENRAVQMRQSWRVIDGQPDLAGASKQQQFHHQRG